MAFTLGGNMNERIKQLESLAWGQVNRTNGLVRTEDFNQKFAELIVKECIDIAYKYDEPKLSGPGMIIGNRIEEHFGVGMSMEDKKNLIKELLGVKTND